MVIENGHGCDAPKLNFSIKQKIIRLIEDVSLPNRLI